MKILNREPALIAALAATVIQMVAAFFVPLSVDQQSILNAVVVAALGLAVAIKVRGDGIAPAALGLVKAALALGIGFGLAMSPDQQAVVMSFAAAISAMFVRTQVLAPISDSEDRATA